MKKNIALFFAFICFVNIVFAKQKYISEPNSKEVILVGRIHFNMDISKEYLLDAFDVPEDKRNYPDLCVLPFFPPEAKVENEYTYFKYVSKKSMNQFNESAYSVNGGYFFVKYKLNSDRIVYLSKVVVFIAGSYRIPIVLPMSLKLQVPQKEKYLYIGDFYYLSSRGVEFKISCSVKDEYESAQKALNKVSKKEHTLCRANVELYDSEKDGKIKYLYSNSPNIKFKKWYKLYDNILLSADGEPMGK